MAELFVPLAWSDPSLAHLGDVDKCMPTCFRHTYPSTFIMLDATELRCDVLSALCLASSNRSSYKIHATVNQLVGVALNGVFTLISQFTSSISDCQLVMQCGIPEYLKLVPAS